MERNKVYYQILFGEGAGSDRDLPDATLTPITAAVIGVFGWMVGVTHQWRSQVSLDFTDAENYLDTVPGQTLTDLDGTTYLDANLMWSLYERTSQRGHRIHLHGLREDSSGAVGKANRVQCGGVYSLP